MKMQQFTSNPNIDLRKLDLAEEVRKLAVADGVDNSAALNAKVEETRFERYAQTVRSYYHGYDEGYAAAVSDMGRPARIKRLTDVLRSVLGFGVLVAVIYALIRVAMHFT